MKKIFLLLLMILMLASGCKTIISKKVSMNKVLTSEVTPEMSTWDFEVAACTDYKDSRQPSSSLTKLLTQVPELIPTARYKECYNVKMDSYASFEVPIGVGKFSDNSRLCDVNILSFKKSMGKDAICIAATQDFARRIKEFKSKNYISHIDFMINIDINNDTGKDYKSKITSCYLDGIPYIGGNFIINKNTSKKIRLSNVASDNLIHPETKNVSIILYNITEKNQ